MNTYGITYLGGKVFQADLIPRLVIAKELFESRANLFPHDKFCLLEQTANFVMVGAGKNLFYPVFVN